MRLTSKGRYAVRAMLDLTFNSNGNTVRLQEISNRQAISLHYLEQLFRKLRTGRVVKSVRGPGGGYVLARSMDEISVKDILDCVGENINPAKDIIGVPSSGVDAKAAGLDETAVADGSHVIDTPEFRLTRGYFENLGTIMTEYLTTTTLGDLFRKAKAENPAYWEKQNTQSNFAQNNSTSAFGAAAAPAAPAANNEVNTQESIIRPNIGEINQ
jgi:Rrf2 family iron-sulfur cluster assembly transcriptional regulator